MSSAPIGVDVGLPPRLSARASDPHFSDQAAKLSDLIEILVDGEVLEEAISYDVDEGTVVIPLRDPQSRKLLFDSRGRPLDRLLRGRVAVRWMKDKGDLLNG